MQKILKKVGNCLKRKQSLVEAEVRAAGGVCTVCVSTCEWVLMREKFGEIEPLALCETCWST